MHSSLIRDLILIKLFKPTIHYHKSVPNQGQSPKQSISHLEAIVKQPRIDEANLNTPRINKYKNNDPNSSIPTNQLHATNNQSLANT